MVPLLTLEALLRETLNLFQVISDMADNHQPPEQSDTRKK